MRTAHVALSVSALLVTTGALAGGCIATQGAGPDLGDAGLPSFDSGTLDASTDATLPPLDATVDAAIDATPSATLSTSTVDFGLVNCGTGTASKTYSFTNSGPAPITYSANIASGSPFSVEGTSSGTVTPGATASITIAVSGIPASSTAGTPITSTLTIATDVPGLSGVNVPLSVTPQGGSLTVAPAVAGFGQVQLSNDGTPIPLTISNVGNAPVTVTFGAPTQADGGVDNDFAIVYPGSPGATTIAAGSSIGDAGATFLPTTAGLETVTAAIQTTDPLCASAATAVAMSGTGTAAQVTVGPDPLQFGTVTCGQTGTALQVTIKNTSSGAVSFTDALGLGTSNSPFTVDVTMGTVPGVGDAGAAGTAVITVTPKKIPVPGSVAPGAFNDTLIVTPDAPDVSPTTISLRESAAGAVLAVTMASGTAFNTVTNQTPGSLPFTVTNTGNITAPLELATTGTGYAATFSSAASAGADGGGAAGNVTFTATTNTSVPGSLTVSTTAALCSLAPAAISLSATGAVPVAGVPVNAGLSATCGNGATPQVSVPITNSGNTSLSISSAASKLGHFTVVSTPAPIGTSGTGDIVIQANAIATSATTSIADTLTFTTNEVGSPTRSVPVTITVNGANLALTMTNTAFGTVDNTTASLPFTVTNSGNLAAPLTLGTTGTGYGAAFTASSTAPAGGSAGGDATFTATSNASIGGTMTISTTSVLCSAPLAAVSLTATGAVPVASVPGTTIAVGAICGGGTTTTGTVTVTNTGNAPLTISGAVSESGHFTVVSSPGPIAAGGNGTITIQASSVGQGTADGTVLGDTLKFTTNEVGSPSHTVPVTVTLSGANLSYVGGTTVTNTQCGGSVPYSVQNTGSIGAYVTASSPYPAQPDTNNDINFRFDFEGGDAGAGAFGSATLIPAGGSVSDAMGPGDMCGLTESPCILLGSQVFTSSGSSTSSTTVGVCIPLPTLNLEMNLTGSGTGTCGGICCS